MNRPAFEQSYWDRAATSDNLRNDWLCDSTVTDKQCLEAIKPYMKGKILEIGCGIGRLTMGYGIDISEEMLERAKPGNEYKLCDGRSIPYDNATFDSVFSMFLFQHLPDEAKLSYCEEVERVLKPGGVFRLQIVTEAERADFSQPVSILHMVTLLSLAGLTVTEIQEAWIKDQWTWLTATK